MFTHKLFSLFYLRPNMVVFGHFVPSHSVSTYIPFDWTLILPSVFALSPSTNIPPISTFNSFMLSNSLHCRCGFFKTPWGLILSVWVVRQGGQAYFTMNGEVNAQVNTPWNLECSISVDRDQIPIREKTVPQLAVNRQAAGKIFTSPAEESVVTS